MEKIQNYDILSTILRPFGNTIILRDFIKFLMTRGVYHNYIAFISEIMCPEDKIRNILEPIPVKSVTEDKYRDRFKQIMGMETYEFTLSWQKYLTKDERAIALIGDTFIEFANKLVEKNPSKYMLEIGRKEKLAMRLYYDHQVSREEIWENIPPLLQNLTSIGVNFGNMNGLDSYVTFVILLRTLVYVKNDNT